MKRVIDPVIGELREMLLRMGGRAEAILHEAVRAVAERDPRLAEQVQEDDLEIDRLDVDIDARVLRALALQAPVASDLREVLSIKMIATDLERVGDLARNIAKCGARLALWPELPVPPGLLELARAAQAQLRSALDAYSGLDARAAQDVIDADDDVDAAQDEVVRTALAKIAGQPAGANAAVDAILVAKHLERVGDHATNVAESVILVVEARNVKHAAKLSRS